MFYHFKGDIISLLQTLEGLVNHFGYKSQLKDSTQDNYFLEVFFEEDYTWRYTIKHQHLFRGDFCKTISMERNDTFVDRNKTIESNIYLDSYRVNQYDLFFEDKDSIKLILFLMIPGFAFDSILYKSGLHHLKELSVKDKESQQLARHIKLMMINS
jgi:hypothetical protein